jgi:hypothetical protein
MAEEQGRMNGASNRDTGGGIDESSFESRWLCDGDDDGEQVGDLRDSPSPLFLCDGRHRLPPTPAPQFLRDTRLGSGGGGRGGHQRSADGTTTGVRCAGGGRGAGGGSRHSCSTRARSLGGPTTAGLWWACRLLEELLHCARSEGNLRGLFSRGFPSEPVQAIFLYLLLQSKPRSLAEEVQDHSGHNKIKHDRG